MVTLEIRDFGVGFDTQLASEGGGLGLATMRQRTERLGGRLTFDSSPGQGTTVAVVVSLPSLANHSRLPAFGS